MRSVRIAVLLATAALAASLNPLDLVEDLVASPSSPESSSLPPPPVKLDKNLRRALLKALVDLEAESAEQHHQQQERESTSSNSKIDEVDSSEDKSTERSPADEDKYDFLEISRQKSASFSFASFPGDEEADQPPSEDKLQNSSFVESDKYELHSAKDAAAHGRNSIQQQPPKDYTKGVQVHHVVPSEKASAIYETKPPTEQLEMVESRSVSSSTVPSSSSSSSNNSSSNANSNLNQIQKSVTFAPITETLTESASGNLAAAAANALISPRPTASTKLAPQEKAGSVVNATVNARSRANAGSKVTPSKKEEAEEVKIFQAPLVAAFTVQQDERGVPKSVVPLFRTSLNNGTTQVQPLSLQEQLEFKQRLLEKQLAQLQAQQIQQTQFLLRQRQAYEEQLRQKQQQEYFHQQQRLLQQQQQQQQQQLQQQQQRQQQQLQHQQQQQQLQQQPPQLLQQFAPPPPQRLTVQPNFQQQPQQLNLVQHQQQPQQLNLVQHQPQPQQLNLVPQQLQQHVQQPQQLSLVQQQQLPFPQQQQPFRTTSVQLQPSLSLEVPSVVAPPPFHSQQLLRAPTTLQQPQPAQPQFQPFPLEFQQPPAVTAPLARFNRQEGFGSVGNFGFNSFHQPDDKSLRSSNSLQQQQPQQQQQQQQQQLQQAQFLSPQRPLVAPLAQQQQLPHPAPASNFGFLPFRQQAQHRPFGPAQPTTPARQIQDLLYQSGIAGDLQSAGTRNQEDINIVSKVLALNVGALPVQRAKASFQQPQQHFGALNK